MTEGESETPVPTTAPANPTTILAGSIAAVLALVVAVGVTLFALPGGDDDEVVANAAGDPALAVTPTVPPTPPAATFVEPTTPPTAVPRTPPPTVAPTPSAVPTAPPTATPFPSPTPTPSGPTIAPVPTVAAGSFDPLPTSGGPIHVPVAGGLEFTLPIAVDASHVPGLSAFYVDPSFTSEVDVFHAYADGSGRLLTGIEDVIATIERSPIGLTRVDELEVDGNRAVVFAGQPVTHLQNGFFTHRDFASFASSGWFTPRWTTMWVIDGPSGVVVVSAEWTDGGEAQEDAVWFLARDIVDSMKLF